MNASHWSARIIPASLGLAILIVVVLALAPLFSGNLGPVPANLTGATTAGLSGVCKTLVCLYLVAMLLAGCSFLGSSRESEDYFLAGRRVTLPAFVATLVATFYGGILAVGEWGWTSGISVIAVYDAPYYLWAFVFAIWLAPKIREAQLFTIPDKIGSRYGRGSALLGAVFVWFLVNPAPYVLMQGVLFALVFGVKLLPALVISLIFSTVYVYLGGFRADVRVNVVQFVLMFVGFAVIIPYCAVRLGGFGYIVAHVPPGHLSLSGGNSVSYIASWWIIALMTVVDPSFHQRCYAAHDPKVAQRGMLISILFWMLFDAMTCTAGLYARAALPNLADPVMAFPVLGEKVLPAVALGLFYVGMLATVMSTTVSNTFICGMTFARDMVWRLGGEKRESEDRLDGWTMLGLLLTSIVALVLAYKVPSVKDLWSTMGNAFIPGLLLPTITTYLPGRTISRRLAPWAMFAATAVSLAWMMYGIAMGSVAEPHYPGDLQPMYPGLLVSLLFFGWRLVHPDRAAQCGAPSSTDLSIQKP